MPGTISLVKVSKIWDRAPHSAFTDLIRFRGRWFCAFRESRAHALAPGRVRVISSDDGLLWESAGVLSEPGIDLRDPKLSVAPSGELMIVMGGTELRGTGGRRPRVSTSGDGFRWRSPAPILSQGDWLWRVTWHRGTAFGVSYRLPGARLWTVHLLVGKNGIDYEERCRLDVPGRPNEATVRFLPDGRAVALLRRDGGDCRGWIGASRAPFTRWSWSPTASRLGGPNFIVAAGGAMWAASRDVRGREARTVVARMTTRAYEPLVELPSGGDCGYPGMVMHAGHLWVSYYSSHEGKASVYLAKLRV